MYRKDVRKYQPIWEALKLESACVIECPSSEKRRIKKAVIAEKYEDLEFKEIDSRRLWFFELETGWFIELAFYMPVMWHTTKHRYQVMKVEDISTDTTHGDNNES